MNYLRDKRVYLTGAITDAKDSGTTWRDQITPRLQELGLNVDDPCKKMVHGEIGEEKAYFRQLAKEHRWGELKEAFWPIVRSDLRMVDMSNFLIAYIDPDVPIVGTTHEILTASFLEQKPVILFIPEEKAWKINPWLLVYTKARWIFTDWEKMFEYLKKIDNKEFDSSRWVF